MFVLTIEKFFSKTKVTKFVTIFVTRDFTVMIIVLVFVDIYDMNYVDKVELVEY